MFLKKENKKTDLIDKNFQEIESTEQIYKRKKLRSLTKANIMKQKPKLINIVNQAKNKNNRDLIKQMQRPKDKMSIVLASGKFIQTI